MYTLEEYEVGLQTYRNLYAKIRVINTNWQELYEWESAVIGSPTFSIDSTSSIRRTCSLTLASKNIKGETHRIGFGQDIWLTTYFQVQLGIENIRTKEIVYTNMGVYMLDNPSYSYAAEEDTFTIKGVDLMCRMTGLRNGNLEGVEYTIEAGTNVRTAIIGTIALAGFNKYSVQECQYTTVPNQINIGVGGTVYDILSELQQIDPNTQMYFDVNGVFHYEKIPTGRREPIVIDDEYWNRNLISVETEYDFESVKNVVEVIGGTHDIKYYTEDVTRPSQDVLALTISSYTAGQYYNGLKVGFVIPDDVYFPVNPHVHINSLGNVLLKYDKRPATGVCQVMRYIDEGESRYFKLLGEITPRATAKNDASDSPFSTKNLGEVRIVLSGGEYDNITTTAQAQARANWELYRRSALTDSITITCVPILWADVNQLIEITLPNETEPTKYMITKISTTFGTSGTQTINASRYASFYNNTPII